MNNRKKSDDKFNKFVMIALVSVMIIAVGIYAYTQLVEKESVSTDQDQPPLAKPSEIVLTVSMNNQNYNYSFGELTSLEAMVGKGKYINKIGKITGPYNYTGVSIPVFLDSIGNVPDNYSLKAVASDNYSIDYTYEEAQGTVMVYNETGGEIGIRNMTMIIAYQENKEVLTDESGGPLRIAFIDEDGSITQSGSWLRSLVELQVID